jgi:hypothetical protein
MVLSRLNFTTMTNVVYIGEYHRPLSRCCCICFTCVVTRDQQVADLIMAGGVHGQKQQFNRCLKMWPGSNSIAEQG